MSDSSVPSDDELASFLGDVSTTNQSYTDPDLGDVQIGPVDDNIESGMGPDDLGTTPVGDGACAVCGAPTFRPPGLTKSGRRKRTPKYCDLHSQTLRSSSGEPELNPRLGENQLQRIQEELADDFRLLGTLTGPLFPVTGYYIYDSADPFTLALLKLAKNNQNALRALHRVAQVAPIYVLARTFAGVGYSVQVDLQKADAHSVAGERLGVARAFDAVYPEQHNTVTTNGSPGPPRYARSTSPQ